jgi:putative DNA primase/helicase
LKRLIGYSLTGLTSEQIFVFLYGPGGNGKGVFINTILSAFGDYAKVTDTRVFMASKGERHPEELTVLDGPRLVTSSEIENGSKWNEARIKQITGGDRMRARLMRENSYEFTPQCTLVIVGNDAPALSKVDAAITRRLVLIPFEFTPAERDDFLEQKLRSELPSILRWAINGCLEWRQRGLTIPPSIGEVTARYLSEQDTFTEWLEERFELIPTGLTFDRWSPIRVFRST